MCARSAEREEGAVVFFDGDTVAALHFGIQRGVIEQALKRDAINRRTADQLYLRVRHTAARAATLGDQRQNSHVPTFERIHTGRTNARHEVCGIRTAWGHSNLHLRRRDRFEVFLFDPLTRRFRRHARDFEVTNEGQEHFTVRGHHNVLELRRTSPRTSKQRVFARLPNGHCDDIAGVND